MNLEIPEGGAIDVHVHPFTDEWIVSLGPSFTEAAAFFGRSPDSPEHDWVETGQGRPIEHTYEDMRDAGVGKAVLLNMVASHSWGKALPNDFIAEYCRRFPDMFLGMGGVDPHMSRAGALREIERCARELKLIGLKFHPAYQDFVPNDRKLLYPLYERCEEIGLVLLFHTGTTRMTRCSIRGCKPEYIDEIATDFPSLRIIMSHFGWPWTDEALAIAWRNENVYLDLSGWLPRYIYGTSPLVIHYLNTVLQDKILFGSDYPPVHPKTWLDDFRHLCQAGYEWGGKRYSFDENAAQKVLRLNALQALGLAQQRPTEEPRTREVAT